MSNHLTHQQMLAYLDGELSKGETAEASDHLHACWTCRIEMERLESDIAVILDAQNETFSPAIPPPTTPWPSFDTLLVRKRPPTPQSMWLRFVDGFHGVLTPARMVVLSVAIAGCGLFAYLKFGSVTASAQQVINDIQIADARRASIPSGNVIRERVHVRRTGSGQQHAQSDSMDAWKSPKATVWQPSDGVSETAVVALKEEYRAHGISIGLPLSASDIGSWGKATGGVPLVTKQGNDLDLRYPGSHESFDAGLTQVGLRVETSTWHVKQMTLEFSDASFEITEDDYSLVPTNEVPPVLLAELDPSLMPLPFKAQLGLKPETLAIRLPNFNLDQVQLSVLTILHRLHADLGEPIAVTHSGQAVDVGIWQLPHDRQNEIRAALQNESGVVILTAPPTNRTLPPSSTAEYIGPPSAPARIVVPAESDDQELLKYFGGAEKEQTFTRDALNKSSTVLAHLYALRNLQAQFPPEREQALSQSDQGRLSSIVRDHAAIAATELTELRMQFSPLNGVFHIAETPLSKECDTYEPRWQDTSLDALGTARSADRLIRDVFTTSESPATPDDALPQLQQKLSLLITEMRSVEKR